MEYAIGHLNQMKNIEKLSYDLINVKEEVISSFRILMNLIEQLDCELHDLIEEKTVRSSYMIKLNHQTTTTSLLAFTFLLFNG